jgi:flagellar hook-associated protein 3 FlgL
MGDLAQTKLFGRRNATLKDSIQSLSSEATTGLTSETTEKVKGDYSALSGIEASLTQLESYKIVTSETAAQANHMQLVLNTIGDSGTALSAALLAASTSNSPTRIAALGTDADQRLQAAMSALNTRFAGKTLFAGTSTDQAAVADADTMLTSLDTAITGALTASDVETAVNTWFADPAGYQATIYQGGAAASAINVGPDQQVQIDVTALDPAIGSMVKGLAMASLLDRGVFAGDDASRAELARKAGVSLSGSAAAFAELTGRLGTTEANVVNAGVQNDAQKTALETARLGLISVDPYESASKLQDAQTQLETLYSITARMSRLSLVNYL